MSQPWSFERFGEYLSYEVLLQAASALRLFEGEVIHADNPRIQELQNLMKARSGKNTWIPARKGSNDIKLNLEGDFYRNKGRLFTSMYIMVPKEDPPIIRLTPFGRRFADGYIEKQQLFDHVITQFSYPHVAYVDSSSNWTGEQAGFTPFLCLLKTLYHLHRVDPLMGYLTAEEVFEFIYPISVNGKEDAFCQKILAARQSGHELTIDRTNKKVVEEMRQITDIMAFMGKCGHALPRKGKKVSISLLPKLQQTATLTYFKQLKPHGYELETCSLII
jgi:hypothetical protein